MRRVADNTYRQRRCRIWWYFGRVPPRFAHLDKRGTARQTLATASVDEARFRFHCRGMCWKLDKLVFVRSLR